jgi:PAS domain S-box-containing protein
MTAKKILVVEDEFVTGADIQSSLSELGYSVLPVVDTGEAAIRVAGQDSPDVILMDITLRGDLNGIDAAHRIWTQYRIPVIFLTAHSDDPTFERALKSEPFGYIIKPFEVLNLRKTIEMALYKHSTEKKLTENEHTILALLNAIPDGLILIDQEKKIVAVNETMARRLGKTPAELRGVGIADIISGILSSVQLVQIDELFKTGKSTCFEEEVGGRWYETSIYPVSEPTGFVIRGAIQSHDISWRKKLQGDLQNVGIARIEKNMEQFQILNDQIRNPLQVMMFYLEMGGSEFHPQIEEQIRIIDNIVAKLDKAWLESTKVRSFLMRHYQHSAFPETESAGTDTSTPDSPGTGGSVSR